MGKDTVKCNAWRVLEPCSNCPFLDDGKAIHLDKGRVDNIKEGLLKGDNFICHKTAYGLSTDMESGYPQAKKMCAGAYLFLKKMGKPNQIMQIAERLEK